MKDDVCCLYFFLCFGVGVGACSNFLASTEDIYQCNLEVYLCSRSTGVSVVEAFTARRGT